jgi:hypothetical protein
VPPQPIRLMQNIVAKLKLSVWGRLSFNLCNINGALFYYYHNL